MMLVKFSLNLVFLMVIFGPTFAADKKQKTAIQQYDEERDGIKMLNSNNYKTVIYNSDTAWLVEFYSKWCGHCKTFASTYKSLAQNTTRWRGVVKLAAVDCVDKNDEYDNGLELCFHPPFFISGMPDLRFIPAEVNDENYAGLRRPFEGKRIYGANGALEFDSDSLENVLEYTVDKLTEHLPKNSQFSLKCLKSSLQCQASH